MGSSSPAKHSQCRERYCCYCVTMNGRGVNKLRLQCRQFESASVRPLLVLLGTVLMIVVGLVGMHILSVGSDHGTSTGTHDTAIAIGVSASAQSIPDVLNSTDTHPGSCDDGCQSSAPQPLHHADMMMACALALVVGFVFLLPLALMYRSRTDRGRLFVLSTHSTYLSPRPQPPSLIVLSISRT